MFSQIQMMWAYVHATATEQSERVRDERGASAVEWAVIIGGAVAIAIGVIAIVRGAANDAANNIPTQ